MRISDWIQTCALPIYVTAGGAPLPVSFTGGASPDPDGDTLTYSWDFGDGAPSSAANPSHSYSATGTFTEIGRAPCRERVCQYASIARARVSLTNNPVTR